MLHVRSHLLQRHCSANQVLLARHHLSSVIQQRNARDYCTPAAVSGDAVGVEDNEHLKSALANKRFFCTQCGKCCTGDGEVWVSMEEVNRIAQHLGKSESHFLREYTKSYSKSQGWRMLKYKTENDDCIFLEDGKCSIHPVRPLQCSTYPWWPGLVSDEGWGQEKELICEGLDHPDAPVTDLDAAAVQLRAAAEADLRRLLSKAPPNMLEVQQLQVLLWPETTGDQEAWQQGEEG